MADQRRLVDDLPRQAARARQGRRAHQRRARRSNAAAARSEEWDAACLVFVSPDRVQHCLLEYVHPGHPRYARGVSTPGRRAGARPLPHARPRARDAPRSHRRRRHGDPHVRPRTPAVHAGAQHEPGPRASGLPSPRRRLGARQPAGVGPGARGRAGRLRQARPARPRGGADAAARLGGHGGLHERRLDRRGRLGRPRRPRAERDGRARRLRARSRRGGRSLLEFADPETGTHPIRAVRRKEEVLDGPYLDRAPDLLLEAAPLYSLTHARRMVEEADWLSGDHRPEGVYVAAGPGARARTARRSRSPTSPG